METIQPLVPAIEVGVPPKSIQPGGGLCMSLELAWGRCRRAILRRFRPGYVRRMAEKRQGHCENCPHEIIDPRDLKFWRNVCGYHFRPEDDRFRWRDHLGLVRAGLAEVVCTSLIFLPLCWFLGWAAVGIHWAWWIPFALLILLWFQLIFFFRDPEREIPNDPALVVSPADGTVTAVGEVDEADFPGGRALRIGIFLSVFNVHVNRVPKRARVVNVRYFPGCFLDARHPDCAARNEQLWLDLEEEESGRPIRVKQISGALARRIVCWSKVGDSVRTGERFGMIKFGSRTEILLPARDAVEIKIRVGDRVKGGSTILLRWAK